MHEILITTIIPLFLMIGLGFIITKFLHVKKESISKLLIYMLSPGIVFYGVATISFKFEYLVLPLIFLCTSSVLSQIYLHIGKKIWHKDPTKNLLAFSIGTGNTGYFGVPIVLSLFGLKGLGIGIFMQLGVTIFENTIGFFSIARGRHSIRESIIKIAKLPIIYAFFLGVVISILGIPTGGIVDAMFSYFKGAYSLFGMMIIGMGIAEVKIHSFDTIYIVLAVVGRACIYPLIIVLFIFFDMQYLHFFNKTIYQVMFIMAIVPIGANSVAYSTELRVYPDKAALSVLISTLLALIYIPFVIKYMI